MAILPNSCYSFETKKISSWSEKQEASLSTEYPFELEGEDLQTCVLRTYLQFLWLPDSIMPLSFLVPSLRRVTDNTPSTSETETVHPLHGLLEPILLSTSTASAKYQTELPSILVNGGGAGEMEETMMWYAVTHESRAGLDLPPDVEGVWVDEKWRTSYLDRMERREVQIQILLYMLKLSLPGPPPAISEKKKKKRVKRKMTAADFAFKEPPDPTVEDHLEAFMDKLATWQLESSLDRHAIPIQNTNNKDPRDWMQIFAEDIVERQFEGSLAAPCSILHSKVFPESLFSDNDDEPVKEQVQPKPALVDPPPAKRTLTREPSRSNSRVLSRAPSMSLSPTTITARAVSKPRTVAAAALVRSRSRSLSLSLAQEQEERAAAAAAKPKKRVLNREVSMSRVFKPKPKPVVAVTAIKEVDPNKEKEAKAREREKAKDNPVTLVEATPAKPRLMPSKAATQATQSQGSTQSQSQSQRLFGVVQPPLQFGRAQSSLAGVNPKIEEEDEEEWMMDSSPAVTHLNVNATDPSRGGKRRGSSAVDMGEDQDEEDEMVLGTPSRPQKKRRK